MLLFTTEADWALPGSELPLLECSTLGFLRIQDPYGPKARLVLGQFRGMVSPDVVLKKQPLADLF